MTRMVFFNIGWMRRYQGLKRDKITGGGAYVQEHDFGHEILNFEPSNGFMYGFAQAKSRIERLGASANDESVDDVLVVWVARDPQGGTFVIGWYDHATVYRDCQPPPPGSKREYKGEPIGFRVKAKQKDCTLLPVDQRVLRVPRRTRGGMGESNVWYADDPMGAEFKQTVWDFITAGAVPTVKKPPIKKGHAWQPDPYKRKKIEEKAIKLTVAHYESLGYVVDSVEQDNVGWDLEAARDNRILRLEVKGLSAAKLVVEMTPNEYQKMQEHKGNYRICVVTNALGDKPVLSVFAFSMESGAWEDDKGNQLGITELVSARMCLA